MFTTFARNRTTILLLLAALIAGGLWATREQPLLLGPLRLDAVSVFWLLVITLGNAFAPPQTFTPRSLALFALASTALLVRPTLLLILLYALIALLAMTTHPLRLPRTLASVGRLIDRTPLLIAAACLALGYGTLAARGVANYDDPSAGAALNSMIFWFVLLAATVPIRFAQMQHSDQLLPWSSWMPVWLYPLVRLYSLGPWNSGWALATALFGGGLALWLGWRVLKVPSSPAAVLAALALASFGLASSAGIAAGCFLVLVAAISSQADPSARRWPQLIAPLVATWMLIGAAVAGGLVALAGVAWVVGLLLGLGWVLHTPSAPGAPDTAKDDGRTTNDSPVAVRPSSVVLRPSFILQRWASLALALAAPLVLGLIQPVVDQLQGGLTPYGDVLIWPWVGMAFVNSAQTQVAVLPSVAVALLLGVLVALVYLLNQLHRTLRDVPASADSASPSFARLWAMLREEVPWLDEGRRGDPR